MGMKAGKAWLVCAALAASWSPGAAVAAPPPDVRLEPSSKWQVDYSDDSCRMLRTFGEGEELTAVVMERFSPSPQFMLSVAGEPLASNKLKDGRVLQIDLQFGPSEKVQRIEVMPATIAKMPGFISSAIAVSAYDPEAHASGAYESWSEEDQINREKAVTELSIARLGRSTVRLALGPMDKPFAAMRKCTDELLTHWGVDLARHDGLKQGVRPITNPGQWIRSSDYPRKLVQNGEQGLVKFRLMVDANGQPSSCHIQRSTRPKEFEDAVCRALMQRARFEPALDAGGKPIASYFLNSVTFRMAD